MVEEALLRMLRRKELITESEYTDCLEELYRQVRLEKYNNEKRCNDSKIINDKNNI